MISAAKRPMAASSGPMGGWGNSGMGVSTSTQWWMRLMWMKPSPWTRGIWGLTWATMTLAHSAAAWATSTLTPRVQKPCSSGGETWSRATSRGRRPERKRFGISERKQGR